MIIGKVIHLVNKMIPPKRWNNHFSDVASLVRMNLLWDRTLVEIQKYRYRGGPTSRTVHRTGSDGSGPVFRNPIGFRMCSRSPEIRPKIFGYPMFRIFGFVGCSGRVRIKSENSASLKKLNSRYSEQLSVYHSVFNPEKKHEKLLKYI